MRRPAYRTGQTVLVRAGLFTENHSEETCRKCQIIYPFEDGPYLVRVTDSGGYAIVNEMDIMQTPECGDIYNRRAIRIIFFGNGVFALPTLEMLVRNGYDVAGVITGPDRPDRRKHREHRPSVIKTYAEEMNIPVHQPHRLDLPDFLKYIRSLEPTLGVVADYRIIPQCLYNIPTWGTINLHSSLLPMYRGASPITAAIKDGCDITGVTVFKLDEGIDTGDIICNLAISIDRQDSAEDVNIKLRKSGAEMVDEAIRYMAHSCTAVSQDEIICDFIQPGYAPKLYRNDCMIQWWRSAEEVYNFIRAHSSVTSSGGQHHSAVAESIPAAWTVLKMLDTDTSTEIKIHKAEKISIARGYHAPGELFRKGRKLMIACSDELLSIEVLQLPGKRPMKASEFCNGFRGICKGFAGT